MVVIAETEKRCAGRRSQPLRAQESCPVAPTTRSIGSLDASAERRPREPGHSSLPARTRGAPVVVVEKQDQPEQPPPVSPARPPARQYPHGDPLASGPPRLHSIPSQTLIAVEETSTCLSTSPGSSVGPILRPRPWTGLYLSDPRFSSHSTTSTTPFAPSLTASSLLVLGWLPAPSTRKNGVGGEAQRADHRRSR